ncbi:MAG: ABC transporter permease [Opitutae bacterium]|nr:ABC transporter permease [Opitutae bacterium]
MTLAGLAFNNIRRTPMRALLTAGSVLVAAATLSVVLSVDRGYRSAVQRDLVERTGVHLYVTKEGCPIEAAAVIAQGGLSPLYVDEALVEVAAATEGVASVLPFLLFAETTPDGTRTDIFMGVTEAIRAVRPDWVIATGGWFTDENSVILGWQMAQIERVGVGERIYSEAFDREFTVSGILAQSYSQDDGILFLPLPTALALVQREGRLSAIALKLKDIGQIEAVKTRLRGRIPEDHFVLGAKELSDGILDFFAATRMIMYVMVVVAFGVSVFGIVNTMLMAVLERRREIAYLKCVGARRRDVVRLVAMETLLICTVGAAAGILAGMALTPLAGSLMRGALIAYAPSGTIAAPALDIALISMALSVGAGVLCALYPAWKAASFVPMEVLRNE